jgi:hypothetical protein
MTKIKEKEPIYIVDQNGKKQLSSFQLGIMKNF